MTFAAIVLAGGAARRLGGVAKPLLTVEGTALLTRVLTAVADARPRIVVGQVASLPADVLITVENPPGSGPVPALRAGVALLPDDVETVAILAADLPFLTDGTVRALRTALGENEAAVLLDAEGRRQHLVAYWRVGALRAALETRSPRVRDLYPVRTAEAHPAQARLPEYLDCDTPADLELARRLAAQNPSASSSPRTAGR
ncbi:MAG: molybdenum cofactor guanylyltransferase [Hamadaea sp.]|uniref:molybdenum cofactor guanylyltransferase n=1 Tax=Hamadaea sp. TaxID=2024425 RepID=UPI0017B808AE|nr:molybdenum cofactor guanylyltransferase [Hamadaea sp.]NUR71204.1 molybdenum cofactor guanylyltransferase [Hamadaea sp.]NUT17735.1 molybdenum cofactor guanylyltransferase [Hamadaea sp.]